MSIELYEDTCFQGNYAKVCNSIKRKCDLKHLIKHFKSIIVNPKTKVTFYSCECFEGDEYVLQNYSECEKQKYEEICGVKFCVGSIKIESIFCEFDDKYNNRTFEHTIYLQAEDEMRVPSGDPFPIKLEVKVSNMNVNITIPAMNLILPVVGFIFTSSGNLPRCLWPNISSYLAYDLQSPTSSEYALYLANDGSIRIASPSNVAIAAGLNITFATSIEYSLNKNKEVCCIPKNYMLYKYSSNAEKINSPDDFLDYFNNDIYGETVAFTWSDNHKTQFPYNFKQMARIGKINKEIHGKHLKLKDPITIFTPPSKTLIVKCLDDTISINRLNQRNLVATTLMIDTNEPVPGVNRLQLIKSYSTNRGCSWTSARIDNANGLPLIRAEPDALFDDFGNHWISYVTAPTQDLEPPFNVAFAVSSDGGITYSLVAQLVAPANILFDYPRIAFGGDGQDGYALWFSVDQINTISGDLDIVVGFITVSGLGIGNIGSLTSASITTNTGETSEITATPDGDVYVASLIMRPDGDNGKDGHVLLFSLFGGVPNYPNFIGPQDVFYSNISNNDLSTSAGGKPVPFQPHRGIYPLGTRGIGYDLINDRLWILGVDMKPDLSNDMIIFVQYSDNNGISWSKPIQISDTTIGCRGLPTIKVNSATGDLSIFWLDARLDMQNKNVNPFGAILYEESVGKCKHKCVKSQGKIYKNKEYKRRELNRSASEVSQFINFKLKRLAIN